MMRTRKSDALDVDAMAARIVARWNQCDSATRRKGAAWYPYAYRQCKSVGRATGYDAHIVAAIVAALSPQTKWSDNIADACDYLAGRPMRHWQGHNRQKMAKCAAVVTYGPSALTGPKETPFYRNLVGDENAVTVDTHAARVALGVHDIEPWMTVGAHDRIGDAYRKAAAEVGVTARTLQAVVWLHIQPASSRQSALPQYCKCDECRETQRDYENGCPDCGTTGVFHFEGCACNDN